MAFSDALILGFDTSAAHCAAALLCGDRVIAVQAEQMGRGQAERLMPLLEEVLHRGGAGWSDLTRIGVGTGPGNFTGIRISVSAARGLSLSLGIPAVGISGFDVIEQETTTPHIPAVKAPRDQAYIRPQGEQPALITLEQAQGGYEYPLVFPPESEAQAIAIARVAAKACGPFRSPAPLYIKSADAAPARDQAPRILG